MTMIWVTGGKGFIGHHLARHLAAEGNPVAGIGHGIWPGIEAEPWGMKYWVNGDVDVGNLEALRRLTGDPGVIFHLAGGSSVSTSLQNPFEDFSRTVGGTARLLDWVRTSVPEVKLVAASSAAVYGAQFAKPILEGAATRPYSPYGHHKLMMEQLCRSYSENYGLRCTIVRLFSVYGPGLRKQLLWDLCTRLAVGVSPIVLGGTGSEVRDWTEVDDVVRLLELAAGLPGLPGETVDGGSGVGTTVAEIARCLSDAWGSSTGIEFSGVKRPGDPYSLVADSSTLAALDFRWQIPVAHGIARYVDWFKALR